MDFGHKHAHTTVSGMPGGALFSSEITCPFQHKCVLGAKTFYFKSYELVLASIANIRDARACVHSSVLLRDLPHFWPPKEAFSHIIYCHGGCSHQRTAMRWKVLYLGTWKERRRSCAGVIRAWDPRLFCFLRATVCPWGA